MDTHETGDGKVMIILQYFNKIWTWWQDPLRALFPVPGTLVTLQSVILGEQIAVIHSQDISCKLFIFVFCFWRFCLLNCFVFCWQFKLALLIWFWRGCVKCPTVPCPLYVLMLTWSQSQCWEGVLQGKMQTQGRACLRFRLLTWIRLSWASVDNTSS